MLSKHQDVGKESEQRDQQRREGQDQKREEVSRRVDERVKMGGNSETVAYQRHEGRNRVHDEDGRQCMARDSRQREVYIRSIYK